VVDIINGILLMGFGSLMGWMGISALRDADGKGLPSFLRGGFYKEFHQGLGATLLILGGGLVIGGIYTLVT
jgi:hypothetical protein